MEYQRVGYESILGGINACPYTGKEKRKRINSEIIVYYDKYGSFRFILLENTQQVSALQVVFSKEPKFYVVANVFTVEAHRRKGHATKLFREAEKYFKHKIQHSGNLSPYGKEWVKSLRK